MGVSLAEYVRTVVGRDLGQGSAVTVLVDSSVW
jgi:hypothetical protein